MPQAVNNLEASWRAHSPLANRDSPAVALPQRTHVVCEEREPQPNRAQIGTLRNSLSQPTRENPTTGQPKMAPARETGASPPD
jgi:hypothetical protein